MDTQENYNATASRILREVPLIDGHNDFPFFVRGWHLGQINDAFDPYNMPVAHTDFNRLRDGQVGGQFWSAYVHCPKENKEDNFEDEVHHVTLIQTLQQIDLIHNLIERYPSVLGFAATAKDVWDVFRTGRVASLIGVEGLHQIANSASVLRCLYRLGVRYVTLSHNSNNLFADAATASKHAHGGLSAKGKEMIKEMNRIGLMIDLSHTSTETQKQALTLSKSPVIFSHSSCHTLCPHSRNVDDDTLDMLKANGGVLMISFLPNLTLASSDSEPTVAEVADHIIYAGERIGYEHLGIGSDFDGVMQCVRGVEDVSRFPALIAQLLRKGVPEAAVRGVVGLNILRVMEETERVSHAAIRRTEDVACDAVEQVFDERTREEVVRVRVGQSE